MQSVIQERKDSLFDSTVDCLNIATCLLAEILVNTIVKQCCWERSEALIDKYPTDIEPLKQSVTHKQ